MSIYIPEKIVTDSFNNSNSAYMISTNILIDNISPNIIITQSNINSFEHKLTIHSNEPIKTLFNDWTYYNNDFNMYKIFNYNENSSIEIQDYAGNISIKNYHVNSF